MTETIHRPNLVNAKEIHVQHPNTFHYPSEQQLENIFVGSWVKISNGIERFWVIVVEIINDKFIGKIDNVLIFDEGYNFDDLIEFELINVYDISEVKYKIDDL